MRSSLVLVILFLSLSKSLISQSRIGTWEDHVGIDNSISVAKFNGKIYASNYSGIVVYDEAEKTTEKINKINGLSDVGLKILKVNPNNNRLIVVYENSNIDVINSDDVITNYSDLFRKNFSGKKNINDLLFFGKMAYLSCGFGIALFDTEKLEIKDTYVIGPNGTNLEVYQIAMDDSMLYAATPLGLYKCNYKTKILNNYQNWQLASSELPSGTYAQVAYFNNKIFANYSPFKQNGLSGKDTVYQYDGNSWSRFASIGPPYHIKKIKEFDNQIGFITQFGSLFLNKNNTISAYVTDYGLFAVNPSDFVIDGANYWIADLNYGLLVTQGSNPFFAPTFIKANGLSRSLISNIDIHDGKVAVSPTLIESGGGATFSRIGLSVNENGDWSYLRKEGSAGDTLSDFCAVMFDRKDKTRMWASSWIYGLLEYKNNNLIKIYNGNNTGGAMEAILPNWWRTSGMDMDEDGNLFFALSDVPKYLSVRKTNGTFQNFSIDGLPRFVRKVLCDKNGQIWMAHERDQGLSVCKLNKSSSNFSIQSYKVLNKNVGSGNLGSNSVYSFVEDLDGKIWVGTAAGIRVFNTPSSVLTGGSPDGEPIKIVQDGNVELLLEAEIVTCMDVDAANNKWVGTLAGGVFCFSPDGQRQLHHFTADNSPLFNNEIIDIKYNGKTGDVFIGTSIGLQSFKNVIMDGQENYNGIYAYPNPVKPGYTGNLYITGLLDNSVVKIADESGNFVWETKSQGGRIEWPLKTFAGNKVASGVYIIYAAIPTAELKAVSKVLVIN